MSASEAKSIVARAIERGLVHPPAGRQQHPDLARVSKRSYHRGWRRKQRARLYARGLTSFGKPRKTRILPFLKGLNITQYNAAYRRLFRDRKPPWVPCGDCDEFWCHIHNRHAHECPCPPIEEWGDIDPYSAIP